MSQTALPVNMFLPISNPLKMMRVGQRSATARAAAASLMTLNSYPRGKPPAIDTSRHTLRLTSSSPDSLLQRSGPDSSSAFRLLKNPMEHTTTLPSFCLLSTLRYTSTADGASDVESVGWAKCDDMYPGQSVRWSHVVMEGAK